MLSVYMLKHGEGALTMQMLVGTIISQGFVSSPKNWEGVQKHLSGKQLVDFLNKEQK